MAIDRTPIDSRVFNTHLYSQHAPPPLPPHIQTQAHFYHQQPAPYPHTAAAVPQSTPPSSGPALPPIKQGYVPNRAIASQEQQNLPPVRHHLPPPQQQKGLSAHDSRAPAEYPSASYGPRNRPGHETPVNRSYSHDSIPYQQTPTTPVQPGPYPPLPGTAEPAPAHHASMEHGAPHAYPPPNGVPHGMPPPQHESHSQYMPPGMEGHHGYPHAQYVDAYSHDPTNPLFGAGGSQSARRKPVRASQACEQCRQRKQKCDEGRPCSFCKEVSLPCVYRDAAPRKTDQNLERLMTLIEASTAATQQISQKFEPFDARLQRIETVSRSAATVPASGGATREGGEASPGSSAELAAEEQQRPTKRRSRQEDHRTAPHKLVVLWPSIKPLLDKADVIVKDSYVMEAEDRGVLAMYTRGDGIDEFDGTQPGGPASPARSEESDEPNAPSPLEGIWSTGFPLAPSNGDQKRVEQVNWGGMKIDNTLDLDVNTIEGLYDSFMKHIHIMHPFVDKSRLRRMFDDFINRYATGIIGKPASFVTDGDDLERAPKRQQSNGPMSYVSVGSTSYDGVVKGTERSPANAIVYLVMALGKICQHQDPLPVPVGDNRPSANTVITHQISARGNSMSGSSTLSSKVKLSPTPPLNTILPGAQPTPSSMDRSQSRSRRSSIDGLQTTSQRNLDVIPGMAYFAKAVEILGEQADGTELMHAQMFLLAGLYKGQLARVKESMNWFCMAGRVLRILLVKYELFNDDYWIGRGDVQKRLQQGQKQIKDRLQNLIVLASWTCLQLETDILADLPLPSSGIQYFEERLLLPHKVAEDEYNNDLDPNGPEENYDRMYYYTAQFWLRKRLNLIHRELYGSDALNQPVTQVCAMLNSHEAILADWRGLLSDTTSWNDNDPPAKNILDARLRAKYWGARYVANRPFLDYALHIMPMVHEGHTMEQAARDAYGNPRDKADIHLFEAIRTMAESEIWQGCRRCIFAAMQSTVALDGVPGRLIVTGIHGTAHAQFGNMLVLAATFNTPFARALVDRERFQQLLERTISFLRRIPVSKTCQLDCDILEKLQHFLFGPNVVLQR